MARVSPVLPVVGATLRPHVARDAEGHGHFTLFGSDGPRFQPVYVADTAEAAMVALERRDAHGRTFELGGPRIYTFRELLKTVLSITRRRRLLVPVPYGLAMLKGFVLERLPGHLLTRDQVELLKSDNVVTAGVSGLDALGIRPNALEAIAPLYLSRFRTWTQNREFAR